MIDNTEYRGKAWLAAPRAAKLPQECYVMDYDRLGDGGQYLFEVRYEGGGFTVIHACALYLSFDEALDVVTRGAEDMIISATKLLEVARPLIAARVAS